MAAGPKKKYTIQIIKVGIGDPLITVQFQFSDSDPGSDNPVEYPVEGLNFTVDVEYENNAHSATITRRAGNVDMANFATLNSYFLTFPFDQPEDFTIGNDMAFRLSANGVDSGGTAYSISFNNGHGVETHGSISLGLTYHATKQEFADLTARFTYCPGGDCIELGTD